MRIRLNFGEFFLSRDSPNRGYVVIRAKTEKELSTLIRNVCFQMQPEFQAKIEGPPLYDGPFQVRMDKAQWPAFPPYFARTARVDSTNFFDKLPYLLPTLPGGTCRPVFELSMAPPPAHRPSVPAKMLRPQPKELTPSAKPAPQPGPSQAPKFAPLSEGLFPAITHQTARVTADMVAMIADFSDPRFTIYEPDSFQMLAPRNSLFTTLVLLLKEEDFLISDPKCQALEAKIGPSSQIIQWFNETPRDQILSFHLTRFLFSQILHANPHVEMTHRIEAAFRAGVLLKLLYRLRDALPALLNGLSAPKGTGTNDVRSIVESKEVWDGDTKYLGYMAREEGRFGSLPKADNYGDESNAEDHDNEWYDSYA